MKFGRKGAKRARARTPATEAVENFFFMKFGRKAAKRVRAPATQAHCSLLSATKLNSVIQHENFKKAEQEEEKQQQQQH